MFNAIRKFIHKKLHPMPIQKGQIWKLNEEDPFKETLIYIKEYKEKWVKYFFLNSNSKNDNPNFFHIQESFIRKNYSFIRNENDTEFEVEMKKAIRSYKK